MMIVIYHFHYDMFGGSFLVDRGQGLAAWFSDVAVYINQYPIAMGGFLMSLCFIGVNIFFVLSGYGLVKKYMNNPTLKMWDMSGQILKILIPYWIAHPLIHSIDWALRGLQYQAGVIDYKIAFIGMHSLYQYMESLLVFPRWFSLEAALSFVGTWWYVGIIVQFYLLFPLLLKLFKKYKPVHALYWCVGLSFAYRFVISFVTGSSPVGVNEADIFLFTMFPARLSEFALGMYLACEVKPLKVFSKTAFSIPLIVLGFVFLAYTPTMFVSDFLFALGGIMLANAFIQPLTGFAKQTFNFIGRRSYAIYLYHEPTLKLLLKFIFPNWIN